MILKALLRSTRINILEIPYGGLLCLLNYPKYL